MGWVYALLLLGLLLGVLLGLCSRGRNADATREQRRYATGSRST
jgi:hypothetical protein